MLFQGQHSIASVHARASLPCLQFSAIASGGILFALFSAPFWFAGYQLAGQALGGALTHERFAIGRRRWRLAQVSGGTPHLPPTPPTPLHTDPFPRTRNALGSWQTWFACGLLWRTIGG